MEENIKGLSDYLAVFKRRRKNFWIPAAILMLTASVVAVTLPSIYQSSATILIEQQDIPTNLVAATATSYADQEIQTITQRVMTSGNLQSIIDKYNLYAQERKNTPIDQVYDDMRRDIDVEPVTANVVNPRNGQPMRATIAFTIAYQSRSPELAQKVANELASLYLNENVKTRTQQAQDASNFMSSEARRLQDHIADLQKKLADYKAKYANSLPELMNLNMQLMQRTDQNLMETQRNIRSLEERKIYLQGQLAQINPYSNMVSSTGERILGPADRLKSLEAQYVSELGIYGPNYPDVVQMKREIDALKKDLGVTDDALALKKQLEQLKGDLADARKKYSSDHPDVKRLERSIAALQKQLKVAGPAASDSGLAVKPDNPAYIQLQAQLDSTEKSLASYLTLEKQLKKKLDDYQDYVAQTPMVEREYNALNLDYQNSVNRFRDLKAKQLEAQLSEQMVKDRKGERFSLIQPPLLPQVPEKPNRIAILFLGFVLSFAGGVGGVAVAESVDTSLRGSYAIASVTGAPPLAAIPYIGGIAEARSRARRKWVFIVVVLLVIVGVLVLINFFYKPLDVLWYAVLRKVGV